MFTKSDDISSLVVALAKAQSEFPPILMDSFNPYYKSKFATLGQVIKLSVPPLSRNGLAISQIPTFQTTLADSIITNDKDKNGATVIYAVNSVGISTTLMHVSGQWINDTICIKTVSSKNPAQECGITISYLRRYSWASILGLYTEEDTDGESSRDVEHAQQAKQGQEPVKEPVRQTAIPSNWTDDILDELVANVVFENFFEARSVLKRAKAITPATPIPGIVFWGKHYRGTRDADPKITVEEAIAQADFDFTEETKRKLEEAKKGTVA